MLALVLVLAFVLACSDPTPTGDGGGADSDGGIDRLDAGSTPVDAGVDAGALPPLRDDALEPYTWREKVEHAIDRATLPAAFEAAGYALPAGSEVFAARIVEGPGAPAYVFYEAGGGGFSQDFWPASTVKVLAALGALHRVRELGFTGATHVRFDSGFEDDLSAIYDRSIRVSSNIDYDRTVRIAGFDWLNTTFLDGAYGFPTTVIQRSYAGVGVRDVPGYTLTEGDRTEYAPPPSGTGDYGCGDDGNCADLFELTEAVRRVVLDAEIGESERFDLDPADIARVRDALCGATPSFFAGGAESALGEAPAICHKPGWVPYNDCLDHGVVDAGDARFLLAASTPETRGRTDCLELGGVAEAVLSALVGVTGGAPLALDAGPAIPIQLDDLGSTPEGRRSYDITVDVPGADRVEIATDGLVIGSAEGPGPRFSIRYDYLGGGERLLTVLATSGGAPVAFRAARVSITPP
jgi:hypothetical protein